MHARALRAHGIDATIHWVPEDLGSPRNKEAHHHLNNSRDDCGNTVHKGWQSFVVNWGRHISRGLMAVKAKWEDTRCSKPYGYRLQREAMSRRTFPMTTVKLLSLGFDWLKKEHELTGTYLKLFEHEEDNKCGSRLGQMWEHLFCHCIWWKD